MEIGKAVICSFTINLWLEDPHVVSKILPLTLYKY